ncbi:MAG TPA: hypothetical protein VFB00_01280 [Terriglobales bacterium]|nr:hypothetical protein [Terriglobales bacterium]
MKRRLRNIHRDESGTVSMEYMLILALVVLPLALLVPLWYSMIYHYSARLWNWLVLPFP